jgi:DNA-binding NarL/FixJ family response regulator
MISPIRILAVDDHALLRKGIAAILANQPDISLVAEASDGREAVDQYRTHRPDITLMDLQMPAMNGLDAMVAILAEFPDARIIVLTTYVGDFQILRAMKAGARGYLLKTLLDRELLETIRAVHAGRKMLLLAAAGKGAISADRRGPRRQCSVAATGHRVRWNWFQREDTD